MTLYQSIDTLRNTVSQDVKTLQIETWRTAARQAESTGRYLSAAALYSRIAIAEQGSGWMDGLSLTLYVPSIVRNLDRADLARYLPRSMYEVIKEALTLASNDSSGMPGVDPQHLAKSLAKVDEFLQQLPDVPEPPPWPHPIPPEGEPRLGPAARRPAYAPIEARNARA